MLKTSLCHYSYVYINFKGTIAIPDTGTATVPNNIERIFENCSLFTDSKSEINNRKVYMLKTLM